MNSLIRFLADRRHTLPASLPAPEHLTCIFLTPSFRTSSHLLVFLIDRRNGRSCLAAKIPRIAGDNAQLEIEVQNLRRVQSLQPGGFESVPKIVAWDDYCGHRFLVETIVSGEALRESTIRRSPEVNIRRTLDWLADFHTRSRQDETKAGDWYSRLVESPLARIEAKLSNDSAVSAWVDATRAAARTLAGASFPLVFEHGDYSPPNILIGERGRIGVVDWELAEPSGLPAVDAFFFLNSAAFACSRAKNDHDRLVSFDRAFFGSRAWARDWMIGYCSAIGLDPALLKPLFLLCWSRYVANIVRRVDSTSRGGAELTGDTVRWVTESRYALLWRHALENQSRLLGLP